MRFLGFSFAVTLYQSARVQEPVVRSLRRRVAQLPPQDLADRRLWHGVA